MSQTLSINTAAGPMMCDARKAAYLADHDTLLLADMHFEKGSYLQAVGGAPLPSYDTHDSLARLSALIEDYRPRCVIALGDSFHDINADERLSAQDAKVLNGLIKRVDDFVWILGNHDPDIPRVIAGRREDHVTLRGQAGGFLLTHHPTPPDDGEVNVCGHLHPKLRIALRKGRASGPCFAISTGRIILPSFGSFTGGLWVDHPAISQEMIGTPSYGLIARDKIYAIATPPDRPQPCS